MWEEEDRIASERQDTTVRTANEIANKHAQNLFWALGKGWVTASEVQAASKELLELLELADKTTKYAEDRLRVLQVLRAWRPGNSRVASAVVTNPLYGKQTTVAYQAIVANHVLGLAWNDFLEAERTGSLLAPKLYPKRQQLQMPTQPKDKPEWEFMDFQFENELAPPPEEYEYRHKPFREFVKKAEGYYTDTDSLLTHVTDPQGR